jgi:hypothetical protein
VVAEVALVGLLSAYSGAWAGVAAALGGAAWQSAAVVWRSALHGEERVQGARAGWEQEEVGVLL